MIDLGNPLFRDMVVLLFWKHRRSGKKFIVPSINHVGERTRGPICVRLIRESSYAEYIENLPADVQYREERAYTDQGYKFFEAEWPDFTD